MPCTHTYGGHVFLIFTIKWIQNWFSFFLDYWNLFPSFSLSTTLQISSSLFFFLISLGVRMLTVSWIGVADFFPFSGKLPKVRTTLPAADVVCQLHSPFLLRTGSQLWIILFRRYIKEKKDTQKERHHSESDSSIRATRNKWPALPRCACSVRAVGDASESKLSPSEVGSPESPSQALKVHKGRFWTVF